MALTVQVLLRKGTGGDNIKPGADISTVTGGYI